MVLFINDKKAGIAQLVEQRTENPRVTSSSLVLGNTKNKVSEIFHFFKQNIFLIYFNTSKKKKKYKN